ncbi:MAG: helix-turn-helix transcriptional regulator [Proteobacteria bacterium]|nr:helix-turn-helix transcriptional regulator [Pseudomonadota bacterium]
MHTLFGQKFAFTRLTSEAPGVGLTTKIPNEAAYIISTQLRDFAHRQLWINGRPCPHLSLLQGCSNLYDLEDDIIAAVKSCFDSVQFYFTRRSLLEYAAANDVRATSTLEMERGLGLPDAIIAFLGHALLPTLARPKEVSALFKEHTACALYAHLLRTYGAGADNKRSPRSQLTSAQVRRVKSLILGNLGGDVSLLEMAQECRLSVSHFTRAFRNATGVPPHRWLLQQRVARAKDLLLNSGTSVAEIAEACGFADQSHLTRVFQQMVGESPVAWRRLRKM